MSSGVILQNVTGEGGYSAGLESLTVAVDGDDKVLRCHCQMQYFSVPHRFLQDSKDSWGFLRIPQDLTIILVILSWRKIILSSPQQSLEEFLLN